MPFIHILLDDIYVVYKMSEDGEYCPIAIPQSLQWLILVWPAVQNSKHQVCYHIRQTEAADLLPSFVIVAWKMTRMTNWLSKSVWMTNQFKWTASGLQNDEKPDWRVKCTGWTALGLWGFWSRNGREQLLNRAVVMLLRRFINTNPLGRTVQPKMSPQR